MDVFIQSLVLNKHPKEKHSTAAGSNKEAENGKTTVLKEAYVKTLVVSSWLQKTNRTVQSACQQGPAK